MTWKELWVTLFHTTDFLGLNIGFLVLHAYCINYRIDYECCILEHATSKE